MHPIQQTLNAIFSILFSPFGSRDPMLLMLWGSVLASVLVLLVYKVLSSQEAIRNVRHRWKAHILEIRLFQDDPVLVGRALRALVAANLRHLRLNVKPLLFAFVPIFCLIVQMDARFGYRPLLPAESAVVCTFWRSTDSGDQEPCPALIAEDGLSVRSPPLRIRNGREICWRIQAHRMGTTGFVLKSKDDPVSLRVVVSEEMVPVSRRNVPKGSLAVLRYPAGQPLPPNQDLLAVEIAYPRRDFRVLGCRIHWIAPFLFLSLLAGYLLKRVFRVQL